MDVDKAPLDTDAAGDGRAFDVCQTQCLWSRLL